MKKYIPPNAWRLISVAAALLFLWLAQYGAGLGIAGVYGESAATYHAAVRESRNPQGRQHLLSLGEQRIARAIQMAPDHPDYVLMSVDFVAARLEPAMAAVGDAVPVEPIPLMLSALATAPVRADLWSRLAGLRYEQQGPSGLTLHALHRALYLGPREYGPLMVNANITLRSAAELDVESRLIGWSHVVQAISVPALAARVTSLAEDAGQGRQLQRLISERDREHEVRNGAMRGR